MQAYPVLSEVGDSPAGRSRGELLPDNLVAQTNSSSPPSPINNCIDTWKPRDGTIFNRLKGPKGIETDPAYLNVLKLNLLKETTIQDRSCLLGVEVFDTYCSSTGCYFIRRRCY